MQLQTDTILKTFLKNWNMNPFSPIIYGAHIILKKKNTNKWYSELWCASQPSGAECYKYVTISDPQNTKLHINTICPLRKGHLNSNFPQVMMGI